MSNKNQYQSNNDPIDCTNKSKSEKLEENIPLLPSNNNSNIQIQPKNNINRPVNGLHVDIDNDNEFTDDISGYTEDMPVSAACLGKKPFEFHSQSSVEGVDNVDGRPLRYRYDNRLREPDGRHNNEPPGGPEVEILDFGDKNPDKSNKPYPGVDDGFYTPDDTPPIGKKPDDNYPDDYPENPHELVPKNPNGLPGKYPSWPGDRPISPSNPGSDRPGSPYPSDRPSSPYPKNDPVFPYAPGFVPAGTNTDSGWFGYIPGQKVPDVNIYQQKKILAQGMMDLALLSANANQLRYVLEMKSTHPYYMPSLVLISSSLVIQICVGIGLIWNSLYNVKKEREMCIANRINNFVVIGIFLVTIINVFISAFGISIL